MNKVCYICGHEIGEEEPYFCIGTNSYVCQKPGCYEEYWWDKTAAAFVVDKNHEYVVVGDKLYRIGSHLDDPKGFDSEHFSIQFFDGICCETDSLWFLAKIPQEKRHIFKENARFM